MSTTKRTTKKTDAAIIAACREACADYTAQIQAALDGGDLALADALTPDLHEARAQLADALAGR